MARSPLPRLKSRLFARSPWGRALLVSLPTIPIAILSFTTNQACSKPDPVVADPPIIIGASVDLTKQKDFGEGSQRVLRVAEQQLNALGGILGRRVVIDVRDDAGDNLHMAPIVSDFLERKVAGFVGPSTTEALQVMHQAFKDAQIPILSPFTTSTLVPTLQSGRDRYLFRTSCAVEYQARAIARYALGRSFLPPTIVPPADAGVVDAAADAAPKDAAVDASKPDAGSTPPPAFTPCTRMAALFAEDSPGQGSATINALQAEFAKYGGTIKPFIITPASATYADVVAKVQAAAKSGEVQCQTALMFPKDGGTYMREFRSTSGGDPKLSIENFPTFGFIRFYQQGFIDAAKDPSGGGKPSFAEGVYGAACNQTRTTSPDWSRFSDLYQSQYPPSVDGGASVSPIPQIYDSVILLALAIEKAGGLNDRAAVRNALYDVSAPPGDAFGPGQLAEALDAVRQGRDIDYNGASGTFDLDDTGDTLLEVILWRVAGSSFNTLPGLPYADLRQ